MGGGGGGVVSVAGGVAIAGARAAQFVGWDGLGVGFVRDALGRGSWCVKGDGMEGTLEVLWALRCLAGV